MKKLSIFFLICFAIVQTTIAVNWGQYPTTNAPGLSDTFLIGVGSPGTGTNMQVSAANLRAWILIPTTNAVIWTNAAIPGKALVVVGVGPQGQFIVAATNWPTGGAGDMIGANNLLDVASIGFARTNIGANNGANITAGIIAAARLGTGGTGGKFLRDDNTFQVIGGGGDMIGANNGLDFVDVNQARTNIGANNAANLTTGTIPAARLGSGSPGTGNFLRGDQSFQPVLIPGSNLSDLGNAATARANLGADNASNLASGTVPLARLPSLALYTNLNAITNLTGGSNVTVTVTVAADGSKSVVIQGITTSQFLTLALSLNMMTNGGQLWTNTTFAANGLLYAGANKQVLSVNVGAGAITNDGAGNFGATPLRDSSGLANNSFAYADGSGHIVSGYDGGSFSNLIGGSIVTGDATVTVTPTRITTPGPNLGSTNYALHATGGGGGALASTNYFISTTNAFLFDAAVIQRADLGVLTNFNITVTNVSYLTNTPSQSFQINLHNPTNGPWTFQSLLNKGGIVVSNSLNTYDTNLNAETRIIGRLDWSRTNLEINIETNWGPKYAFTNSSQGGGGGGGGGTGLFPSDSVVLNWLLNNSLADASGNGNTATYSGPGATYVADESGTSANALSFNGTSEYIEAASSSVFNPTTADFSIVIYMTNTITDFSSSPVVLGNGVFGNTGFYMQQHVAFGGNSLAAEVTISWHDGGGDKTIASTDRDVLPNVNYCIVFVRNGTSGKIYVNGVDQTQAAQPTIGTIASSASKFTVGKYLGGPNFLPAKVQQVIIYSRALTPTEVSTGSAGPSQ